jgi:hypothetical protein
VVGLELPERALDLLAVGDRADVVGRAGRVGVIGEQPDHGPAARAARLTLRERDAVPGDDPVRPGIEAVRVAQTGKLVPDRHEGLLHGVLRAVVVAGDAVGDREQPVRGQADEALEGLLIAALCSFHKVSLHRLHRV